MACHRSVPDARRVILIAGWLVLAGGLAGGGEQRSIGNAPGGIRLAATVNGQAVRCLDGQRNAISSFDVDRPDERREVVGPRPGERCVAIGCLPGDLVVAVYREGESWWLRSYRIEPGLTAAAPLQEIALGTAAAAEPSLGIAVSPHRGWLAIVGLPRPLPPVMRAALAGVRIGPLSERSCPELPDGVRPVAATVSPRDELVLVLPAEPGDLHRGNTIAYYDLAGHQRAGFDSGLTAVRGIAFDRRGQTLSAIGGRVGSDEAGLWRLDAAVRDGRQVIRPTLLVPTALPRDLVAVGERGLIMLTSDPAGGLVTVLPEPTAPAPVTDSGAAAP